MFSITYPCVYVCRSVIGYDIYIYNCPCVGIRSVIYYACLNTIKYYTVQVTNLYTDASDSQDNHIEVYNIIWMQMTPKIITIRYIKRNKTLATLKFSTAAYRVVVSTDHIRLNTWPSIYLYTPKYRLKMMHLHAIISKNSSLMQGVSANNHRRFDLP